MRLIHPHDVPRYGIEQTFRQPRLLPLLVFAASAAFAVGWTLFVMASHASVVAYLPACAAALVAGFTLAGALHAFRSGNWLLKAAQDGVYLQLRPLARAASAGEPAAVVHLAPDDIAGVRVARERLTLPNRDGGDMTATLNYLDLVLSHGKTEDLHSALDRLREDSRRNASRGVPHLEFPVRLAAPDTIRVHWTVRPDVEHAARHLADRYGRAKDAFIERDPWHALDEDGQEALIVDLSERGEVVTAIRLAQIRYGLNAREARRFVHELMRQPFSGAR